MSGIRTRTETQRAEKQVLLRHNNRKIQLLVDSNLAEQSGAELLCSGAVNSVVNLESTV